MTQVFVVVLVTYFEHQFTPLFVDSFRSVMFSFVTSVHLEMCNAHHGLQ